MTKGNHRGLPLQYPFRRGVKLNAPTQHQGKIMRKILYILSILIPFNLFAQPIAFQQEQYPFPITFYGIAPQLGFLNANSEYHPYFCDINNDLDYDLFIGCNMGKVYYLENIGNVNFAEYKLVTTQFVPPVIHYGDFMDIIPCLVDIDNDDDYDLFLAEAEGFIWFYENTGFPDSLYFELVDTSYFNIDVPDGPVLDFVDIDNDNDLDMFIGVSWSQQNGRLYFYRNEGTPDTADMVYITDYFEEIDVGEKSSPEFCDIDNDEDYDLFIGCEEGTIWFYENIGTPDSCDFEYVTDSYFDIYTGEVSVPRFCDIDNDGDYDLFVANESAGYSGGMEGDIAFYRNTGSAIVPNWEFVTGQYLFMDMGDRTSPNVIDIDDDGVMELLVGIGASELVLFENEGVQTEPSFSFTDSTFLDLNLSYNPVFSFRDLDGDQDLDFVVSRGGFTDYIDTYKNIGTSSQPEYAYWENITSDPEWGFSGVDLCDIDGDDDYDLFFADEANAIQFWENIGNNLQPRFSLASDNFLNQPTVWSYLYPRFCDLDHDGDNDLLMGHNEYGAIDGSFVLYWENIGDQFTPNFVPTDTIAFGEYPYISEVRPCLADIDCDGDEDIFAGEGAGAMLFFRNMEYNSAVSRQSSAVSSFALYQNYPNPFNAATVISFELRDADLVSVNIFNINGQDIGAQNFVPLQNRWMSSGYHEIVWDASEVSSGVYLVRLNAGDQSKNIKTILVK